MLSKESKIFVAGHQGMVGSAIARQLETDGYRFLVTRSRDALNLAEQSAVRSFFRDEKIDYVVLAAAKVGGIFANNEYPADFIYENLIIECNIIHEAFHTGVMGLLFLGSSCIYPKLAEQPMKEDALLTGKLEPTNEPYAIAKIAGIKLCESYNRQHGTDYRSLMPTNIYGPNDNYHGRNSHVIPALIKKFHEAKISSHTTVEVWGTGKVQREFLHVDDLARACVYVMNLTPETYASCTEQMSSHINVGYGSDISIMKLAELIKSVIGFEGKIVFDTSKPDGTPRKLMDSDKLTQLGWAPEIPLESGLESAYAEYLKTLSD